MDINENIKTFIKNYKKIFSILDKFDDNDFKIVKECEYFDLSKSEALRTLRTHSNVFHLDEVAGLVILLMCNKIRNKNDGLPLVIRTRNEKIINDSGGICFDVSGKFEFNSDEKKNFGETNFTQFLDHHQKGFDLKWDKEHSSRLATFGLILKNYGKEAFKDYLKSIKEDLDFFDDNKINKMVNQLYTSGWGKVIDCIDNADVKMYVYINENGKEKRKEWVTDTSSLSYRIKNFYPNWEEENKDWDLAFIKAYKLVKKEMITEINKIIKKFKDIKLKRKILLNSYNSRENFHESGKILFLNRFFPYLNILNKIENEKPSNDKILFVIYPDENKSSYLIQAVRNTNGIVGFRNIFIKTLHGYKNEGINLLFNRNDIKFIHNNGHFAGSKSLEGALFLCEKSLL